MAELIDGEFKTHVVRNGSMLIIGGPAVEQDGNKTTPEIVSVSEVAHELGASAVQNKCLVEPLDISLLTNAYY